MIGKLIHILRQEEKIGVIAFADKLDISRISLYRIEKGLREPSEETAIRALHHLGVAEELIYRIFILQDVFKHGVLSPKAKEKDAMLFLKQLNKNDRYSKIIYRYFEEELYGKDKKQNKKK